MWCAGSPANETSEWVDPGQINVVNVTGLKAGVDIQYQLGTSVDGWSNLTTLHWSPRGSSASAPGVSVLVAGDLGTTGAGQNSTLRFGEVLSGAAPSPGLGDSPLPTLALIAGDLSYAMGRGSVWVGFDTQISAWSPQVVLAASPGNHEIDDPLCEQDGGTQWCPSWGTYELDSGAGGECGVAFQARYPMDGPWWSTEMVDPASGAVLVHFTSLSTEIDFLPGSAQYAALQADMQAFRSGPDADAFLVAVMHRPMYDATPNLLLPEEQYTRDALEPLFAQFGVDLVLEAHVHVYQRTCAVFNGTCVDADLELQGQNALYRRPRRFVPELHANTTGRPVVCVGNGGKDSGLNFFIESPPWLLANSTQFGIHRIDVPNNTALRFRFFPEDSDAVPFDEFWISRQ
jgi:hypothetical protein